MRCILVASLLAAAFVLHGCGNPPLTPAMPDVYSTVAPGDTTASTTITTTLLSKNIWEFRRDQRMGTQTTHDLSGNNNQGGPSIYMGCWADPNTQTLAGGANSFGYLEDWDDQFWEDGQSYGRYDGVTGVTLYDKINQSGRPGCLMRKSRLPINFHDHIQRMELDIVTSAGAGATGAPWYSVWLSPMLTNTVGQVARDGEIDLIENIDGHTAWHPINKLSTQFSDCGQSYMTDGSSRYCKNNVWGGGVQSYAVDHHITLQVKGTEGSRTIEVCHCAGSGKATCETNDGCAEILIDEGAKSYMPPTGFPVWREEAKQWRGHYWLVADIWLTSGRPDHFQLSVDNVKFFDKANKEWEMPLDGAPPSLVNDGPDRDPAALIHPEEADLEKNPSDPTRYEYIPPALLV